MEPFLKQVASHYYGSPDIQRCCFLFPNRRSMVFFRKYLSEAVREQPLLVPPMYTINDFFCKVAGREVTDRLRLLLELYAVYSEVNPKAESLDEFIFWGDVMLSDFDDIDKYLVDAAALLQNVSDFKDLQDSFDYLSDAQRLAIEQFLAHFRDGASLERQDGTVKGKFVRLWNLLYPIYGTIGVFYILK